MALLTTGKVRQGRHHFASQARSISTLALSVQQRSTHTKTLWFVAAILQKTKVICRKMASKDVSSTLEDDRMSRISTLQFPMKLHVMLEESRKRGLEEIVCWSSSGGFRIYDKRRFESEIMPLYFKSKTHKVRKRAATFPGTQLMMCLTIIHQPSPFKERLICGDFKPTI